MLVLVTGSHGRIGANLVQLLLKAGHSVRGFVFPGDASRAHKLDGLSGVETQEGDLRDRGAAIRAVDGVDAVVHLAAAFAGPYDNVEYLQVNGMGTLHLLEAARERGDGLRRFVYASTEAIYWKTEEAGRLFDDPISEDDVSATHRMPYFLTKWIGEELCSNYHAQFGVPTVSFRLATVFEPSEFLGDDGLPKFCSLSPTLEGLRRVEQPSEAQSGALAQLEQAADEGKQLLVSRCPDGRSYKQEWCDVRDIARGLMLGLERDEAVGQVFTLGGMKVVWEDDVPRIAERLGVSYADVRLPSPNHFEFDATRIRRLLGYKPALSLDSTLDTALAMREGKETDVIPTGVRYG